MCEACKNSGNDNCTGCNHFENLFGYNVDINKKNPSTSSPDESTDKVKKAASSLKDVDVKGVSDKIGDFLKGLKAPKVPASVYSTPQSPTPQPKPKAGFNYGWAIGIVLAIVVIFIAFKVLKKK